MHFIQVKLMGLQQRGWSLAALADELRMTVNTIEKWKAGSSKPRYRTKIYNLLDQIEKRKRIPKKRRYAKGRYSIK
jgi:transcriptional regulator with XRE-family HTH domain